jgi:hypothetical protein
MRGADQQQSGMFSYISAERRVPKEHRLLRSCINVVFENGAHGALFSDEIQLRLPFSSHNPMGLPEGA